MEKVSIEKIRKTLLGWAAIYPFFSKQTEGPALDVAVKKWFDIVGCLDLEQFEYAIDIWEKNQSNPPSPASIRLIGLSYQKSHGEALQISHEPRIDIDEMKAITAEFRRKSAQRRANRFQNERLSRIIKEI